LRNSVPGIEISEIIEGRIEANRPTISEFKPNSDADARRPLTHCPQTDRQTYFESAITEL
jgi:hypothetical protein